MNPCRQLLIFAKLMFFGFQPLARVVFLTDIWKPDGLLPKQKSFYQCLCNQEIEAYTPDRQLKINNPGSCMEHHSRWNTYIQVVQTNLYLSHSYYCGSYSNVCWHALFYGGHVSVNAAHMHSPWMWKYPHLCVWYNVCRFSQVDQGMFWKI